MGTIATAGSVFSTGHIALTAILSGVVAAIFAVLWMRGEGRVRDAVATGLLSAGAAWRRSVRSCS
jgi:hypothetical protein